MKVLLCTVNLLQFFVLLDFGRVTSQTAAAHGNNNCHPYSASDLDTSQCTDELRAQQMVTPPPALNNTLPNATAFRDIYDLLTDATTHEHTPGFASFELIWMYQYLHCTSDIDAVADLFYNVSPYRLPDNQSPFWLAAYNALHPTTTSSSDTIPGGIPVVGRRKRQSDAVAALATELTKQIIANAHPSCVQWLINEFKAAATDQFKRVYTNFPNPNDYPLGTITDAPTHPSHTTHPHTPHTTHPHTPHTTHPTTTTTTTTPAPTTTSTTTGKPTTRAIISTTPIPPTTTLPPPMHCYVCNGLNCLIQPEYALKQVCPKDRPICTVHIREGANGRDIDRGCASVETCIVEQQYQNEHNLHCDELEDVVLPWHTSCRFCCYEEYCNNPPLLKPKTIWNGTSTA